VRRAPVLVRERGGGLRPGQSAASGAATLFDTVASEVSVEVGVEPPVLPGAGEGTVGVASGDQPQPSPSVGEDEAMEGEKR
jgi:ribonuclease HII